MSLTHTDEEGRAKMVDVGDKPVTTRTATASGFVRMAAATLEAIREHRTPKGDPLEVARVAGIMAAKRTSELIPLCHNLPLTQADVQLDLEADGIAITATARKLACLFWVLLWRQQDYAFGQPSLTAKKIRRLEITAGAPRWHERRGVWIAHRLLRDAELDLARQAEHAYAQTVRDRQAAGAIKAGASVTPGRASQRPSKGKAARQTTSP